MRDQKIRKYYDLKHVAQMRVAITNVMEATLESAFQLILQLYIVGTRYTELDEVSIFFFDDKGKLLIVHRLIEFVATNVE